MTAPAHGDWDVIVVGAGPAGAITARTAATRGARVLLLDKSAFPRPKVCGCCLNARALATLGDAGLRDEVFRSGAIPLARMVFRAGGRLRAFVLPPGAVLSRDAFDLLLVRAAVAAGVTFIDGSPADIGSVEGDRRRVTVRSTTREVLRARVVVDATGLGRSRSGRRATRIGASCVVDAVGAPAGMDEPGQINMACGRGGYVGSVLLENGRLDVAGAFDPTFVRTAGGPGAAANRILSAAGSAPFAALASARWRGTPPLGQRPRFVAAERLCRVGDAAGYVEPFTGEGMAWALAGGQALAPLVVAAARDDEACRTLPADWTRTHAYLFRNRHRACRRIARLLRMPQLAAWSLAAMDALPSLNGFAVRCVAGAGTP